MIVDKNTIVLGVLEFSSIAIGIFALDQMVKIAPVRIIDARTICPGKYLIVFSGDVASAEYSYHKGFEIGSEYIVDSLFLPMVHSELIDAIGKIKPVDTWESVGIIETLSVTSAIEAADIAAKASDVTILEIRLAIGFGGKSYMKMMGRLHDVEASMLAAVPSIASKKMLCAKTIISHPHKEIKPYFLS